MEISEKEVEHIADLARLKLTETEKKHYARQLGSMLDYIGKLNELDTRDVEPTSHLELTKPFLRKDECKPSLAREELLKNGPKIQGDFFSIPKVIQ